MRRLLHSSAWLRWVLACLLAWGLVSVDALVRADAGYAQSSETKKTKKKKARKKRKRRRRRGKKGKKSTKKAQPKKVEAPPPAAPPAPDLEALRKELEAAKAKAEGRKASKVTPGTASRWSNRGAMQSVDSDVPITAPLPQRAVPVPMGVATPGQDLIGEEELLSARLAFSVYHMQTRGQDFVFEGEERLDGVDRDIQLIRGRAQLAYERIAGSDFGVHMDLEYRPVINGARFTDSQLNELYVSYGPHGFSATGRPELGAVRRAACDSGGGQCSGGWPSISAEGHARAAARRLRRAHR